MFRKGIGMLMNDNLAVGIDTRTTRIKRTNADFYFSSADDADNADFKGCAMFNASM